MKAIISIFIAVMLLSGCATFNAMFPPPPEPVCDRPEAVESVICREFKERGIEPEQYENLILDSVAIAALVKPEIAAAAKRFILRARMGFAQSPLLTLGSLFTWVELNEQEYKAISGIFSRRLPWLKDVDEILTSYDLWLIEEHLKHIEELL